MDEAALAQLKELGKQACVFSVLSFYRKVLDSMEF